MPFCSFDRDAALYDATPIENMFLLEYLPTAPDGYLRVYLYARMLCLHPELGDGLDDVARALHMDESKVYDAMTYWERQGLVRRLTDRPPTYAILPVRSGTNDPMEKDYYEYRDFNARLQALFGDNLLHPRQYEIANDWLTLLGFSQDAVITMVEGRLKRTKSKKPDVARFFNRLNETAVAWADRGVRTAEEVERAMLTDGRAEKTAAAVMKRFSMGRPATADELALAAKWLDEWGFTHDEILDACRQTTKSRNPTLAYLDAILDERRKGGGKSFEETKAVLADLGAQGRPTPEQISSYEKMIAEGFEPETIRLAAAQQARKGRHRFEDLEWMVSQWRERGLYRFEDADQYVREMNLATDRVRALLQKCGADRRAQMEDVNMYTRWQTEYPWELIDYAAECAKGMQMPMRYIDRILAGWKSAGVTTVDAARAQHEARSNRQGANPALGYEQRDNKPEDYDDLFIDLSGE